MRQWGARFEGEAAWWSVHGRNKRCVTLDLKKPRARELALGPAAQSDALPEYGALGTVRQPTRGAIATAAPSNAYRSADGIWVLIAANSDPLR